MEVWKQCAASIFCFLAEIEGEASFIAQPMMMRQMQPSGIMKQVNIEARRMSHVPRWRQQGKRLGRSHDLHNIKETCASESRPCQRETLKLKAVVDMMSLYLGTID